MGFREVGVIEMREVLRAWLDGAGTRTAAERAGVDRKTARRYVEAAAGSRAGPRRPGSTRSTMGCSGGGGRGPAGPAERSRRRRGRLLLAAREQQISDWVAGKGVDGR